ncbi:TIGR03936 family radical SAM-associated protein [Paludicola sp. MB14-C6]|uniref:TIGR03936 family radical SAM-associated protein n=1 Tax=Paludihabitans sp. MB14-C6 TaxID=3070656 RepID=UPI0027DEAA0D|nr:TIGR03936 family radical SAM-associated protein [Paludicola sp. MB14-C6]WMJ23747.1 TIGR03936 family radical SAM-associated protein [Paludicola sp. MB14-C6]
MNTKQIPISEMINIRVFYNKKSRAKYISHLDITRCMQRALKRAGLPIWYTEGFNPHIYLTFALPLSLGYESESESMDLRLVTEVPFEEVKDCLNRALPPDIRVTKVQLQKNKPDVIKTALYEITLKSDTVTGQVLKDCLDHMFSEEKIEVVKKTKKGNKMIDIKPDLEIQSIEVLDYAIHIELIASAGIEKNINPTLMTDELIGKYNLEDIQTSVMRKAIYDANGNEFE